MILLIKLAGWTIARCPRMVPAGISSMAARLLYYGSSRRRLSMLGNLHRAFPDRPREWHAHMAIASCRQRIENRLLAIALPSMPARRLSAIMHLNGKTREKLETVFSGRVPTVMAIPQIGAWELATVLPLALGNHKGTLAIPYRRLASGELERWLLRGRERFGVRILKHGEGFVEGLSILQQNGVYGILFDQKHTREGLRTQLLNRITRVSEFPGLLVEHFGAHLIGLYTERISCWHYAVRIRRIRTGPDAVSVTIGLNRWLEELLRSSGSACGSWPWIQDRWEPGTPPRRELYLNRKKVVLLPDQVLDRTRRLWIRLPDNPARALRTVPLLRALRRSRPDAALTLLGDKPLLNLLRPSGLFESEIPLPEHGLNIRNLVNLQLKYPDVYLALAEGARYELEAWLIGCPRRYGIARPGRPSPFLTDTWEAPDRLDERTLHETRFLQHFLVHFGLKSDPDYSPVDLKRSLQSGHQSPRQGKTVGLFCGGGIERWPIENWAELASCLTGRHSDLHLLIFGARQERISLDSITDHLAKGRFTILAQLPELMELSGALATCDQVISTDTCGLHLANALGIPVIGLYGQENPIRVGPVFNAPCRILLPPGCRPTGGLPVSGIRPSSVIRAVEDRLERMAGIATAT